MSATSAEPVWEGHFVPEGELPSAALPEQLRAFERWQIARWPKLGEAIEALGRVKTREITVGDRRVVIQWNPGRATSSTAKVDPAAVSARPCFLCPANHPPEERGLPFGPDLVILPNPAPIIARHVVVAHRAHRPQDIGVGLAGLLDFALAAGSETTALYNGPRSGASAPDHLHLQGVASGVLPEEVFARTELAAGRIPGDRMARSDGFLAWSARDARREILGLFGRRDRVEEAVRTAIAELSTGPEEPQLNVIATVHGDRLLVLLFPRGAHRPAAFFSGDCLVSPGVIDMAGLVVTVREVDYQALDSAAVEGIFREVTLPRDRWTAWNDALVRRWSDG